jgi:ribosomal protein S12 methylthiotransferase accessory factor
MPRLAKDDILDEIAFVVDLLKKKGFERVIVVDLTRPEVSMPTVRVIVPGARGLRHRPRQSRRKG